MATQQMANRIGIIWNLAKIKEASSVAAGLALLLCAAVVMGVLYHTALHNMLVTVVKGYISLIILL